MVNVVPDCDERRHAHATDCWCNPKVEWAHPETEEVYSNGPLVIHSSVDCREAVERLLNEGIPGKRWKIYED